MMYSDDDMLDPHGIESGEDYSDYNEGSDIGEESYDDFVEEDDDHSISSRRSRLNYVVLKEDEIRKLQKDDIGQLSTVLSISEVEASVLLLRYHWNTCKVHDEWFADEERVRSTIGTWNSPVVPRHKGRKLICGICFKSRLRAKIVSVSCGHRYCVKCWTMYISVAINDGPGCLMLKCPEPSCPATFGQDIVNNLSCKEDREKYSRFFLRSYIEDSRKMKWCTAPGCDHAIGFSAGDGGNCDVVCLCSHTFCWNCMEDAHRPVDCDTVRKWMVKTSAESENVNWLLANSKPCPKCKRPIEKNLGCMHMTCRAPCNHHFCWLCLGAWTEHGTSTGGFYDCNKYTKAKQEGLLDEAEMVREMAKNSIEKYTHYFERWSNNQKSRQKAMEDLQKTQSVHLKKLSEVQCTTETQLEYIIDAWLQIIECRRVLKWTYAYGYYLPEDDDGKKKFFEYLQGEAESGLERLHKCVETELQPFRDAEEPSEDFIHFRPKLVDLTNITKTYFENLVKALENGLADVDWHAAAISKTTNSESSSKKKVHKKGKGSSRR